MDLLELKIGLLSYEKNSQESIDLLSDGFDIYATTNMLAQIFDVDLNIIDAKISEIMPRHKRHRNTEKLSTLVNLDVMIEVSYRINHEKGNNFMKWLSDNLNEKLKNNGKETDFINAVLEKINGQGFKPDFMVEYFPYFNSSDFKKTLKTALAFNPKNSKNK